MTRKDATMIMAILQAAFPAFYRNTGAKNADAAVNLWADMFADDDAREVAAAVKALIATQVSGYPPTIGAVKDRLQKLREPDRMEAQEAWKLASKAAAGNLPWKKLPPLVQRAIGSEAVLREWGMTDIEAFNTVIYSQFLKAYKIYDAREVEMNALPSGVYQMLNGLANKMALSAGREENAD